MFFKKSHLRGAPDLVCTFWDVLRCLHVSLVLRLACETHLGEISIQSFGPENGPVVIAIHGIVGEASRFCRTFASTSQLELRVLCWTLPLYDHPIWKSNFPQYGQIEKQRREDSEKRKAEERRSKSWLLCDIQKTSTAVCTAFGHVWSFSCAGVV